MNHTASLFRVGVPFAILLICTWLIGETLSVSAIRQIPAALSDVPMRAIIAAAIFSSISLWAVGQYDLVAHRHLQTGIKPAVASRTGTIAIALSQTLGFGLLTGAFARWRMLPGLSSLDAMRLSAFVCVSFMSGLALVTSLVCLVLPAPGWVIAPALIISAIVPIGAVLTFFFPQPRIAGRRFRLPSHQALGAIIFWIVIDTTAACMALWVLLPGIGISFSTILPIFLLALGAALLSGTPGGVGPFELALITLLPQAPQPELLAGIVAFRAIYYAVPAVFAAVAMIRPFDNATLPPPVPANPRNAARAEVGVATQNGGFCERFGTGSAAFWPTGQHLVAMFDPIAGSGSALVQALPDLAHKRLLSPCLYKCTSRTALAARQAGWHVAHIADEAVLYPLDYRTDIPARRRLRRKLRSAERIGITVTETGDLPWPRIFEIDRDWQAEHGHARGGTMGRVTVPHLGEQRVFLAWRGADLIGFASFHTTDKEWCLDILRHNQTTPDGTMHALVHKAIHTALAAGIRRVSLAAVPACPDPENAVMRWISGQVVARAGGAGLRQFKSSFAPNWQPLYAAAPTKAGLAFALADIARAIHFPPCLEQASRTAPHNEDEYYEVVSRSAA